MKIIEYNDKYLEDVRDLLVELEKYIISIDEDNLDQIHSEYREKMALLDLEEVNNYNDQETIKLERYLSNLVFTIDDYNRTCKEYSNESLFLRIRAIDEQNETTIYEIPLSLNSC